MSWTSKSREAGAEKRKAAQSAHDALCVPHIRDLRLRGMGDDCEAWARMPWAKVAHELNARRIPPPRRAWSAVAVRRIAARNSIS